MEKPLSLSVIFPMYNERYFFRESLLRLLRIANSHIVSSVQVVIVDDCSTDLKAGELEEAVAGLPREARGTIFTWEIHRHQKNSGKGRAIQTGISFVNGDITVIHDADLEYDPSDIMKILRVFIKTDADAVYGSRFLPSLYRRVLYFRHQLGNKLITLLVDLATDLNLSDVETCYKAVRTELLRSIPLYSRDFCIEVELTIKLSKREAKIYEVPISYQGRTYEEGKKINWKDGVKTLFAIMKYKLSDDIYIRDEYGSRILGRLSRAKRFNRYMADTLKPHIGDSVLEIGSGTGNITRSLLPRAHYYATDINPLYLQTLQNLKETRPFLDVQFMDIEHIEDFKPETCIDSIICINVLEHIDNDTKALESLAELLNAGGRAVILVPNSPYLFSSLDQVLGHKRRYTRESLQKAGQEAGLALEKMIPFNRLGTLGWVINGKLLKRKHFSLFQIKMLNLIVPLLKLLDKLPLIPPLSLIAVFRKETGESKD